MIGLAARYADAGDLAAFRHMLREGRSGIGEVPPSRWRADPGPDGQPDPFQRWGGFLANAEGFDPLALRISGKEAELTDPQHRVFLMEAWHALEDAGYGEAALDGRRCGVFVGAHGGDYTHRMVQAGIAPQAFAFMGNAASILAARIAYMLNLKGPAMAIDTACSSSLVAVHLACRSLLDDECDMALAGGVFVSTTKGFVVAAGTAGMLSPNGRCATFDAAADGFVPGEGTGAVVLKRLDRALADGDHVDAVIVASGVNQDGKTNGITAPSPESQAALIRETYRRNGIDPRRIGYVEAHGTGTPLGDPIEIEGLSRAWADWPMPRGGAAVGSVKTNIGHAAHAAGIAGFIKAVLAVRDGEIYPSLHFRVREPEATARRDTVPRADGPGALAVRPGPAALRRGQLVRVQRNQLPHRDRAGRGGFAIGGGLGPATHPGVGQDRDGAGSAYGRSCRLPRRDGAADRRPGTHACGGAHPVRAALGGGGRNDCRAAAGACGRAGWRIVRCGVAAVGRARRALPGRREYRSGSHWGWWPADLGAHLPVRIGAVLD